MAWGHTWTEQMLDDLEPDEHSYQEFKASPFMVTDDHEIAPGFLFRLSKQVSAFANGHGGRLFIGIDDQGRIDGGVPRDLKGGGVREWLEDVVPGSVDPPLRAFNVFEVPWPGPGVPTSLRRGCAVYVVEIQPSHDAPHQAQDYRYYLRIAGKSRPMSHLHLEDISRRTRTPRVRVGRLAPFGEPELVLDDPRGPKVQLQFQVFLLNEGRVMAQHCGGEIVVPRPLVNKRLRQRLRDEGVDLTQTPGELHAFRYHPRPLFPGQELPLTSFWVGIHENNLEAVRSGESRIGWRVYADDAPATEGDRALHSFGVVKDALRWVESKLR
ncbi:MAG: ATP-binding protein [Deltaproteobacteria bacterium]|nr:MAG: ATP-binding protein [Deltaproteobacteria bacterium]